MPKKSNVWQHFTRVTDEHGKFINQAKCNYCRKVLKTKDGTANMWKHLGKFHAQEAAAVTDVGLGAAPLPQQQPPCVQQPICNPSCSGASKDSIPVMKKNDEANRWLAQMIVFGKYDPEILKDWHFWSFTRCLNPEFAVPSRRDIEEICDGMLDLSWNDAEEGTGYNFCLSVGKAKTMEREVLYIARHYIGVNGCYDEIKSRVLYAYEVAPRDEYYHGPLSGLPEASLELVVTNILSDIPEGTGLFMMACEKMDAPFVHKLKERMKRAALGCQMNKEPFCAIYMDQVIHSIARYLLPDLDFTNRMYSTVKILKLTRQSRKDVLKERGLDDPWEYNELWYSCYCSLEVLRKECSSTIAAADFEVIGILCNIWGKLYRSIKTISNPDWPTSHLCLVELFNLREALQSELESATVYFVDGLRKSIAALDEAIQDSYLVWSIPLAMDPRYKLEYIEILFETTFGSEAAGGYIARVKGNIKDLYSNYDDGGCTVDTSVGSASPLLRQAWNKLRRAQAKTDLDRYLQDTLVPEEEFDTSESMDFWWKSTGAVHYPKVARMAYDALAMPTSSRLSSVLLATVRSIIRGYYVRPEEEEEEEEDDDDSDSNVDAMIEELNY